MFPKVGSLTNLWSSDKVALALQNVLKNCHAYHLFLLGLFPSHTGPLVTGVCNDFASDILTVVMNDIVNIKKKKKKKKKFGVKGRGKRVREPHGWVAKGSFPEKVLLKLSPVR